MKSIIFRPLRRIKKTGKITVASYTQWRKVMTADYNRFNLVVNDEYKRMPSDEFVYNHEGKLIYFYTYNPADIPVYDSDAERIMDEDWLGKIHVNRQPHGIRWNINENEHINYICSGMDCCGVPTFSHWTEDKIAADHTINMNRLEPLTVGTVVKWLGWFLFQLNNSYLQMGK